MSTSLKTLENDLAKGLGDYISEAVTTNIAADNYVISTELYKYTKQDDYFNGWYCYITDKNNAGVDRQVSDYAGTATGTLTLRGSALTADTAGSAGVATFELSRYSFTDKLWALNQGIEEVYPNLYKAIDNQILITGNYLPNAHFEDWDATTTPDFYTAPTGTVSANTTSIYIRGGGKSAKLEAGATPDYYYISSVDYPQLLDLMGKSVTFKCWAYPAGTADIATIQIYTQQADSTAQTTLISTTSCPADMWSLLELENQGLNDDLVTVEIRFRVSTSGAIAYFDDARLTSGDVREYVLPTEIQDGDIKQVFIQSSGFADDMCDDLKPQSWERIHDYEITSDGTYDYLKLRSSYLNLHRIRIRATDTLGTLSTYAGTIDIDKGQANTLVAYATYLLLTRYEEMPSGDDIDRYERASAKWYARYRALLMKHKKPYIQGTIRLG